MKKITSKVTALIIINIILFSSISTYATVFRSIVANGNWSNPATWDQGSIPSATDSVYLSSSTVIIVDVFSSCAQLFIDSSNGFAPTVLNIDTGMSLQINGNIFLKKGNALGAFVNIVPKSTLNVLGDIYFLGTNPTLVENKIVIEDSAFFYLRGNFNFTNNLESLNGNSNSTFVYNGNSLQILAVPTNFIYDNLILQNTSPSGMTMNGHLNAGKLTGNLIINTPILNTGLYRIVPTSADTFNIGANNVLILDSNTASLTGFSTYIYNANSTVKLNGSNQTIDGSSFQKMIINGSGTKQILSNSSINDSLIIKAATLNISTNRLDGPGVLSMNGGELQLAKLGVALPEMSGVYNLSGGTINFNGAGSQIINALPSYYNIWTNGTGIKTLSDSINIKNDLAINLNTTLDITNANHQINIGGNWLNNGEFNERAGEVNFNGTSTQTITGIDTFYNFTVNNSSSIDTIIGTQYILNFLTLNTGTLNTNDSFTLGSNSSLTASIIPNGGNINGDVTVQRYIDISNTNSHLIGSCVSGTKVIDYDDNLTINGVIGADAPGSNPNIFYYDEALNLANTDTGFVAPTDTGVSINVLNDGYLFNIDPTDLPVTIDVTGPVNINNHTTTLNYTNNSNPYYDGRNLVSNPFPFPIDWNATNGWTLTNIASTMHYFDENSGIYRGFNDNTGQAINNGSAIIPSSQAFWVQTNNSTNTFSLDNQVRSGMDVPFNKTTGTIVMPTDILELSLYDNSDSNFSMQAIINFINGADTSLETDYDSYQFESLDSTKPFFASLINNSLPMAINSYPELSYKNHDVPLFVEIQQDTSYTIMLSNTSGVIGSGCVNITLEDLQTSITTNLVTDTFYTFNMLGGNIDTARFILHIQPTVYADFSKNKDSIDLKIESDIVFTNNSLGTTYEWDFGDGTGTVSTVSPTHTYTNAGQYITRLIAIEGVCRDTSYDTVTILNTTGINSNNLEDVVSIFPNPANRQVFISLNTKESLEDIYIKIYNMTGKQVYSAIANKKTNKIDLTNIAAGIYTIRLSNNSDFVIKKLVLVK